MGQPKKSYFFYGVPTVESISLQRRVTCEPKTFCV